MIRHHQIRITGKLENSGIRFHTYMGARKLNIAGEVRLENNVVIIEAEGDENALYGFERWCKNAPDDYLINTISVVEKEVSGYDEFRIK